MNFPICFKKWEIFFLKLNMFLKEVFICQYVHTHMKFSKQTFCIASETAKLEQKWKSTLQLSWNSVMGDEDG